LCTFQHGMKFDGTGHYARPDVQIKDENVEQKIILCSLRRWRFGGSVITEI